MILESFPSKFSMKYFGVQQIIHINDLLLMKQTAFQNLKTADGEEKPCIYRLYEYKHPYYYIEYYPKGSDSLQ